MIQKLAWLSLAGAVGTLARYGLAGLVHRIDGSSFPWGTVTVNIIGCFIAGWLYVMFENRWPVSGETRTIILVGFMGAFTTFSAMILETGVLLRSTDWLYAAANIVLQNGVGFISLWAGMTIARMS
jgi:CrcB protein